MRVLPCTLLVSLLCLASVGVVAQNRPAADPAAGQDERPQPILADCEGNIAYLSNAHQIAEAKGTVIAIARLGTSERGRELNQRRLHNIRTFLVEFWKRSPETVVVAEGERVSGDGRVEIYVRGMLFAILAVRRNQDLLVGSCEPDNIRPKRLDKNLYPYRDKQPRRP